MALKIVYKICCGIDVHKTFVVACIASTNSKGVTTYETHRFSTYTKGLKNLLQWLLEHNCKDVCMESTGKYWIPIYNVLENDCTIVLAHPKYVKAIRGKKLTRKMRNGLLISSSMTLLPEALCHLLTSDSFVTLCVTASNLPALNQAKRIVCRTVSRFPISSWETLFRTPSANLLRRYWINFWKIPQILPLTLNLLFSKV